MKNYWVAFAVVILVAKLSSASVEEDRVLEVQWAPTKMSSLYLDNMMSEQYCGYEASRFKGCAAAADKFAYYTNPSYEIYLVDQEFAISKRDPTVRSFRDELKIKREKFNKIEEKFSKATVASLVKIYKRLRSENKEPKPFHIAASINEFYAVAYDPHQMIQPTMRYDGLNHISQKPYIGMTLKKVGSRVGVGIVYKNTPAELAGIKPGDTITSVNGKPYFIQPDQQLDDVLNFVDQEKVELTLERDGRNFSAQVVFGYHPLTPVVDRTIQFNKKRYAYLYMRNIPSDLEPSKTCDIFSRILKKMNDMEGLVLDLRGNVGGPGETVACLAGLFVGKTNLFISTRIRTTLFGPLRPQHMRRLILESWSSWLMRKPRVREKFWRMRFSFTVAAIFWEIARLESRRSARREI